jgi:hypothetical protein
MARAFSIRFGAALVLIVFSAVGRNSYAGDLASWIIPSDYGDLTYLDDFPRSRCAVTRCDVLEKSGAFEVGSILAPTSRSEKMSVACAPITGTENNIYVGKSPIEQPATNQLLAAFFRDQSDSDRALQLLRNLRGTVIWRADKISWEVAQTEPKIAKTMLALDPDCRKKAILVDKATKRISARFFGHLSLEFIPTADLEIIRRDLPALKQLLDHQYDVDLYTDKRVVISLSEMRMFAIAMGDIYPFINNHKELLR